MMLMTCSVPKLIYNQLHVVATGLRGLIEGCTMSPNVDSILRQYEKKHSSMNHILWIYGVRLLLPVNAVLCQQNDYNFRSICSRDAGVRRL